MELAFALLGLAICSVWAPNVPLGAGRTVPAWLPLFLAAAVGGLASGILTVSAIPALTLLVLSGWAAQRLGRRWMRALATVVCALLALALAVHVIPGFHNPIVVGDVRLSEDSAPYSLKANFDKGAAGLILLAFFAQRIERLEEMRRLLVPTAIAAVTTTVAIMALALAIGYVRPEPKLPSFTLAFLAANLLITSAMEEAFFRGLIQERLMRALAARPSLRCLPIAASSALFGLAHAAGGPVLMLLATLAGVGYSLAYAKTRRIEVAVLTHFTVNVVHFFGFTYPSFVGLNP